MRSRISVYVEDDVQEKIVRDLIEGVLREHGRQLNVTSETVPDDVRVQAMQKWAHVFVASRDDGMDCAWVLPSGARCGYPKAEACHVQPEETVLA